LQSVLNSSGYSLDNVVRCDVAFRAPQHSLKVAGA